MPLIESALPVANSSAPTMFSKNGAPPESTLKSLSTANGQSDALIGVPSEYFIPLRRVSV
jgi:hypothetical protein